MQDDALDIGWSGSAGMGQGPPRRRRSTVFLLLYALANAGGVIAYLPLLGLLLPIKVEAMAHAERIGVLAASAGAGAIAAAIANVGFGWASDLSVARGQGRRGWLAGGLVATLASLAVVAGPSSPTAMVVAIFVFQVAVNALLAPLTALMADEIPDAQKGAAAGLLALGTPLASLVGAASIALFAGEGSRLVLLGIAVVLCIVPLLVVRVAVPAIAAPPAPRAALLRTDLAIAWAARLAMQTAACAVSLYLLYVFESITRRGAAELAGPVATLLIVASIVPLPIAVVLGRLSDRRQRAKPALVGAALVAAAGLAGMAGAQGWLTGAAAFILFIAGSTTFAVLHLGLAMRLLPDPAHRGRDLGILNLTNTLPTLLGLGMTWWMATPDDFAPMLLSLAALALGAGALVLGVRGVR